MAYEWKFNPRPYSDEEAKKAIGRLEKRSLAPEIDDGALFDEEKAEKPRAEDTGTEAELASEAGAPEDDEQRNGRAAIVVGEPPVALIEGPDEAGVGVDLYFSGARSTDDYAVGVNVGSASTVTLPAGTAGKILVVYDASGNAATCAQKVTVEDHQVPTITCPADVTVNTDAAMDFVYAYMGGTAPPAVESVV